MNKKVQKVFSGTLTAAMAAGIVGAVPAGAVATADQLYAAAFNAVQTAKSSGLQADINTARTAIDALNGTGAAFAIGEFSKQVDQVQQPILVNIITAISAAQTSPTQANVNAAKAAIDPGLPQVWKNSYSAAVDAVEGGIIQKAVSALATAQASKSQADVTAAKAIINDLMTSSDSSITGWVATNLQTPVNAIVPVATALGVLSASAVNSTTVQVKLNQAPTTTISASSFSFSGGAVSNVTKVDDLTYNLTVSALTSGTTYTVNGVSPVTGSVQFTYTAVQGGLSATFNLASSKSVAQGQALVSVGTVTLTASTADATITGIKLTRTGLSADTDIASVSVYDGNTRLNVPAIISNGVADINFTNALTVTNGTSKVLTIKVNVSGTATTGAQVNLSLADSSSIKTAATLNATFPASTGTLTVATVNLGTLTVAESATAPTTSVNPSSLGVAVGAFDLTANTENQTLNTITVTQSGSAADSDIANLKLYDGTTQLGTTVSLNNRTATFVIPGGLALTAGTTKTLTVKADIVSGSGRHVELDVANVNDVQTTGNTYGTTIVAATTVTGNSLLINSGTLIVSQDSTSPLAGTINTTVSGQTFEAIKIQAVGEPVQVQKLKLTLTPVTGAVGDLTNLKIVNSANNQVLANVAQPFPTSVAASTANTQTITLTNPITVQPGTPVVLDINGDLTGVAGANTYTMAVAAGAAGSPSITAVGSVSGLDSSYSAPAAITSGTLTTGSVAITPSFDASALLETPAPGATGTTFDTFALSNPTSSTVTVYQLEIAGLTNDNMNKVVNLMLKDQSGNVVSNVVATHSSGTTSTDVFVLNTPVDIIPGSFVKFTLVGDLASNATLADTYSFGVDASGAGSGTVVRLKSNNTVATVNALGVGNAATVTAVAAPTVTLPDQATGISVSTGNVQPGATNVKIANFRFNVDNTQDVNLKTFKVDPVFTAPLAQADIKNIRLEDATGNIYASLPYFTSDLADGGTKDTFTITTPLKLAKNGSTDLYLVADIDSGAHIGGAVQIRTKAAAGDFTYALSSNGTITNGTPVAIAGGPVFTMTDSNVTVAAAVLATAAPKSGAGEEVGRFTFTNNGTKSIVIDNIDLADVNGALTTDTVRIYDSSSNPISAATALVAGAKTIALTSPIRIDAGQSATVSVRVTTVVGGLSGANVAIRINNASATTYHVLGSVTDEVIDNTASSSVSIQ